MDATPLSGKFYADLDDIVALGDSISFTCTDEDKVLNNGLDEMEVPCLLGGTFEWPNKTIIWPGRHEEKSSSIVV